MCQEILSHDLVGKTCGAVELTEEETCGGPSAGGCVNRMDPALWEGREGRECHGACGASQARLCSAHV